MIKFIRKFVLSRKNAPVLHSIVIDPVIAHRYFNVNKIASSLEKANTVLENARINGNADAIHTWEIIVSSLRHRWNDCMVEVATNGHYTFE